MSHGLPWRLSVGALFAFLVAALPAQAAQVFIVDPSNGPGTNFTNLQVAADTVPDGSILRIRGSTQSQVNVDGKGLSLWFEGPLAYGTFVTWANTTASQTVEVRGVHVNASGRCALVFTSCHGPVRLFDVNVLVDFVSISARDCPQFYAQDCQTFSRYYGGVGAAASRVVLVHCTLSSLYGDALTLSDSAADLVGSSFGGLFYGANGIWMSRSYARMLGSGCSVLAGDGAVDADPASHTGAVPVAVSLRTLAMPCVLADGGALGGTFDASLDGPAGDLGILFAGLAGPPWTPPGLVQDIWLQPGTEVVCGTAVLGATLAVHYPIANLPAFLGTTIAWQGASLGPLNGLQLSNPALTTVH